jgi:hypothetical protein
LGAQAKVSSYISAGDQKICHTFDEPTTQKSSKVKGDKQYSKNQPIYCLKVYGITPFYNY